MDYPGLEKQGGAQKLNFQKRAIIFLKKISPNKKNCELLKLLFENKS